MSNYDTLERMWPDFFGKKWVRVIITIVLIVLLLVAAVILIYHFVEIIPKDDKSKHSDIYLSYLTEINMEKPKLSIINEGNLLADSIWLSQKFYLVDSSENVFECDLPRYVYRIYNGSERMMFDLEPGKDTSFLFWQDCFIEFWTKMKSNFDGKIIMRWQVDFNDRNVAERQTKFFYFLLDQFLRPIRPIEQAGGNRIQERVEWYEKEFRQTRD